MSADVVLDTHDLVGLSFWIISAAMLAATVFFVIERDRAVGAWKTSLTITALVTGIAALHYFYMRAAWVQTGQSPTSLRYVDWFLTVPLQIIEFYLILVAIAVVRQAMFWRLLVASVWMLVFGYMGEIGVLNVWLGFVLGMLGWLYIIYEIYIGEASQINAESGTEASKRAFDGLRLIVTVGWSIYPIGYILGYTETGSVEMLNIVYNFADFVNKIAFGVIIWAAAVHPSAQVTRS